jgi:hypothetical protein
MVRPCHLTLSVFAVLALAVPGHAVEGVKLINQAVAMNGSASPGDEPGFPVTISEPGSYRLSGNLTVPNARTTAIEIAADDVTVDLNGFAIIGLPICLAPVGQPCLPTGVGIRGVGVDSVTIVNGSVRGLGADGIRLSGRGHHVERVRAMSNGGSGIVVEDSAIVTGNIAVGNGRDGIRTGSGSVISGNVLRENAVNGIKSREGSVVSGNAIFTAGRSFGIGAFHGSLVTGNVVRGDPGHLSLSSSTAYSQNVLTGNDIHIVGGVSAGHNVCGTGLDCP